MRGGEDSITTSAGIVLPAGAQQRAGISLMSVHAVQTALRVAEIVCEATGSTALYAASSFDRRRRDLMTIAGHLVGQRRAFETAGQFLFGEEVPTFI